MDGTSLECSKLSGRGSGYASEDVANNVEEGVEEFDDRTACSLR